MTTLEKYCSRFEDMDAAAARWNRDADDEDVTLEELEIAESLAVEDYDEE